MASFNELTSLFQSKIPDSGDEQIDPLDVRACLEALAASISGQSNINVTSAAGSASLVSAQLIGKTVTLIVGDGFSKTVGFSQPSSNGTLAFTDGSTFPGGPVTIFFL